MGRHKPGGEPAKTDAAGAAPAARTSPVRELTAAEFKQLDERLGKGKRYGIAKAAGLTNRHVTRVLQGKNNASMEAASWIADAARVGLDEMRAYIAVNKAANREGRADGATGATATVAKTKAATNRRRTKR